MYRYICGIVFTIRRYPSETTRATTRAAYSYESTTGSPHRVRAREARLQRLRSGNVTDADVGREKERESARLSVVRAALVALGELEELIENILCEPVLFEEFAVHIGDDEVVLVSIGRLMAKHRIRRAVFRIFENANDFERSEEPSFVSI